MGDHPYPPEQMAHQLRSRAAHEAIRPGDLAFVVRGFRGSFGGQSLERDEGGGACALPLQIREGSARMLEPLDDDPLETIAEHSLHRRFEAGRAFEEIGHRAHHTRYRRARLGGEERPHAGAVAFALAFETPESFARRFLRGDGHAHGGQRFLGLGAEDLLPAEFLLDLLALSRQKSELDVLLLEAHLEPPPGRGESIRLGAGRRGLAG